MRASKHFVWVFLLLLNSAFAQSEYGSSFLDHFHISGEAGAGFFDTGENGQFPNAEFRVDEAKLFIEAKVIEDIYVFSELNFMTREEGEDDVSIGELYIEFEDVSKLWDQEDVLNIRAGRMDIPFGEEYQTRDVIDNPLISHSISDIWGVDEGIELYGTVESFEYTFAVQNGGIPKTHDYNSDKALIGRILFRPGSAFHAGFSAMRTGNLDGDQDYYSALWFGNGLLYLLSDPYSAATFEANVIQGDGHFQWNSGHVHAAAGKLKYEDEDPEAYSERKTHYYQIEAVQNLNGDPKNVWYVAARYSRVDADPEFPIIGNYDYSSYYSYAGGTKFLWRLALGSGYRIGRNFLLKAEYNFERGEQADGTKREKEDFFGVVVAAKF